MSFFSQTNLQWFSAYANVQLLGKHDTKDYGGKIRKGEEPWPPQNKDDATSSPTDGKPATQ